MKYKDKILTDPKIFNRGKSDVQIMESIFLYSDNFELRVKTGEWLLKNVFGKDSKVLNEASLEIDDILYEKLKPIKEAV